MCNVKNAAINMNVNSERMPMFLTIFASLMVAIYDEQLDAIHINYKMTFKW
jgi:hypothetical protein